MKYSQKTIRIPVIDGLSGDFNFKIVDIVLKKTKYYVKQKITSPDEAISFIRDVVYEGNVSTYEQFFAIYLAFNNELLGVHQVSKGGIAATVVDPKIVASTALKLLASKVIISHNHPSGNEKPSEADFKMTQKIIKGLENIDIEVLDHIVITENSAYSFADNGDFSSLKGISEIRFAENNLKTNTSMITKDNYFSKVKEVGIQNLPATMQEIHTEIADLTSNGSDWSDFENEEFKPIIDIQFKKLQEWIDKDRNGKNAERGVKPQNEILITKFKKKGIENLTNSEILELANTITFYERQDNDEGEITDLSEARKIVIEQFKDFNATSSKAGRNQKRGKVAEHSVRKKEKSEKRIKKMPDNVENLSWPVRIAKRFASMNGKTFDKAAVGRFIKFIQKPIITKDLRKTDNHSDVVMDIQEFLVKIFNSMSGPVKIEIDSSKLEKFKTLGHSQKVMPAVSYIKRFLNMYPSPTKEAAAKLRIEILNAIESKAITETNPYAGEIREIVKALEKVKDGGDLKISQADLKGLQGICSLCLPKKKSIGKVSESENERILDLFEEELITQAWFKKLTGIKEFACNQNYSIDYDHNRVWIEVFGVPEKAYNIIGDDYNVFSKPFNKWAKERGLIDPEIMTDEESGSISFVVSKSTGVNGLGNPFVTSLVTNVLANTLTDTIKKTSVKTDTGGPISADHLSMMKFKTIGLKGKYGQVIGDPEVGFSAIIFGPPKNGKSTFAIDFARHLAEGNGKTLYCAIEEGYGYTLQDKIKRLGATHSRLSFSDRLLESYSGYDFVFIDSTNKAGLTNDDCEKIKADNPETSFIFIMQSTKDGKFRGDQTFAHDQDIIIQVENGVASVMGRFAPPAEMKIFEKQDQNV